MDRVTLLREAQNSHPAGERNEGVKVSAPQHLHTHLFNLRMNRRELSTMDHKELRELVRDLAGALLDAVGGLQAAEDVFDERSYSKEMAIYERAVAWLKQEED